MPVCDTGEIWNEEMGGCIQWTDPTDPNWEPTTYDFSEDSFTPQTVTGLFNIFQNNPDGWVEDLFQEMNVPQWWDKADEYGMYFPQFDPYQSGRIEHKFDMGEDVLQDTLAISKEQSEAKMISGLFKTGETLEDQMGEYRKVAGSLGLISGELEQEKEGVIARAERVGEGVVTEEGFEKDQAELRFTEGLSSLEYARDSDLFAEKQSWYRGVMRSLGDLYTDLNLGPRDCAGDYDGTKQVDSCGSCRELDDPQWDGPDDICGALGNAGDIITDNETSNTCMEMCVPTSIGIGGGYSMICYDDCMLTGGLGFNPDTFVTEIENQWIAEANQPNCEDWRWEVGSDGSPEYNCVSIGVEPPSFDDPICGYNELGHCVEGGQRGPCSGCGDTSDDGSCFHPDTTVELEDGTIKTMRQVKYGDMVKAVDRDGNIIFSEVWEDKYFNYKDETQKKYYITIKAGNKTLKLTTMHTIFVENLQKNINAHKVKPGMYVNVIEGREVVQRMVDSVTHSMEVGKYDLYTREGTVVVNGIVAGTLALWPHKFAQWWHKFFNNNPRLYTLAFKYIYNPIFNYCYRTNEEYNLRNKAGI